MPANATLRPTPRPGVMEIEAYVPGKSAAPAGVKLYKLSSNETPLGASPKAIAALGGEIIGNAADSLGLSLLVALPGETPAAALAQALEKAGAPALRVTEAGSHAARFDIANPGANAR